MLCLSLPFAGRISIGFESEGIIGQFIWLSFFFLESGSHLFIQCLRAQTCIRSVIYKCHLPNTFCTQAPYQHIGTSALHSQHCAVIVANLAHVHGKQIYFGISWPECASNLHQASFHLLCQTFISSFCCFVSSDFLLGFLAWRLTTSRIL